MTFVEQLKRKADAAHAAYQERMGTHDRQALESKIETNTLFGNEIADLVEAGKFLGHYHAYTDAVRMVDYLNRRALDAETALLRAVKAGRVPNNNAFKDAIRVANRVLANVVEGMSEDDIVELVKDKSDLYD